MEILIPYIIIKYNKDPKIINDVIDYLFIDNDATKKTMKKEQKQKKESIVVINPSFFDKKISIIKHKITKNNR